MNQASHLGKYAKKGNKIAKDVIEKRVANHSGEKHWNWKGGLTKDRIAYNNIRNRNLPEEEKKYISWLKNRWYYRKKAASGTHTFGEWNNLKAQYNWTCPYCKKEEPEIKLTQDHIIPLSKGGSDNIENIQPLCKSCNCKKYNSLTL